MDKITNDDTDDDGLSDGEDGLNEYSTESEKTHGYRFNDGLN